QRFSEEDMALQELKLTIRKDDQVQVISGREKGKTGKVLKVDAKNGRLLIEGVNVVKRHVKPSQLNPQGGIQEKESPLNYSNALLVCPKCERGVRHGIKVEAQGKKGAETKKVRVCKKCGGAL